MIKVELPSQLSGLAAGHRYFELDASTLGEVFGKIDEIAPMIRSQIFDPDGAIRQFVGVFVDEQQIRNIGDGSQPISDGSRVLIVMSVAGG
jgi:adenylyltransferase/sulfurtransferase